MVSSFPPVRPRTIFRTLTSRSIGGLPSHLRRLKVTRGTTRLRELSLGQLQGEKLRGTAMATYVVAEGNDGYRVIFSAAELDSGIIDSEVIVADTMDGKPIGQDVGPLRLVAPHEKRPARWVRMLTTITVVHPPK